MEPYSSSDLGRPDRHGRRHVRRSRRVRSRHRRAVSGHAGGRRPRRDDELGRAVLGRQRDVAGARRRRAVGRVPDRLCRDHAGVLSPGDRDAAGARPARRVVRVPLGRETVAPDMGCGVRRRLDHRGVPAGRHSRRTAPGRERRRSAICGRRVRLADAIRDLRRSRRGGGIRTARCDVAGDAHVGSGAGTRPPLGDDPALASCSARWW